MLRIDERPRAAFVKRHTACSGSGSQPNVLYRPPTFKREIDRKKTDFTKFKYTKNESGNRAYIKLSEIKSKNIDVDYFPFEVTNKERISLEIINEIAPNAQDWEIHFSDILASAVHGVTELDTTERLN